MTRTFDGRCEAKLPEGCGGDAIALYFLRRGDQTLDVCWSCLLILLREPNAYDNAQMEA